MLVCPVCGFRNPHSNERCLKCSALLQRHQEIIDNAMYEGAVKARRQYWSNVWAHQVESLRQRFDFPSWHPQDGLPYRYPWTAGGLSVLPGLGQVYNGQKSKAVTFAFVWFALLALCVVTITQPYSNWLLLILLLTWMLVWSDAVGTAIRTNGQHWSLRNSLALLFGAICLISVFITALQFFGMSFFLLIRVRQAVHAPLIKAGDRVWVNEMRYFFSLPKNGELIYFDPPRFTAERDKGVYSINITSYFQRVLGREGDLVEKKDGRFFRNGVPIQPEQWPLGAEKMGDFSVRVPEGKVMAPVTYVPQDIIGNMIGGAVAGSIGTISYVNEPGYVFPKWLDATMISRKDVYGAAVAVVDPPEHRQWL